MRKNHIFLNSNFLHLIIKDLHMIYLRYILKFLTCLIFTPPVLNVLFNIHLDWCFRISIYRILTRQRYKNPEVNTNIFHL